MSAQLLTPPSQDPGPAQAPDPAPDRARNRRALEYVLWVIGITVVVLVVGVVLLASAVLFGRSQSRGGVVSGPVVSEETMAEPADAVVVEAAPIEASSLASTEEVLMAFGQSWRAADWATMATFASDEVIDVAQEWYMVDGYPEITDDSMPFILDTCSTGTDGLTECFFLYSPPEGFGLIFNITLVDTETGPVVSELTFGGDAG